MRKPRKNPGGNQPQSPVPSVATEQQFVAAMQYATAHEATINAMYRDRQDRTNQCFVLVDVDNHANSAILSTLAKDDPDGAAQYVSACRANGVRPWLLALVLDAVVRTLTGIDATNLRAGMSCRPNIVPVVALSLPAGLQFVSATPSEGTYDPATGLWSLGTLATSQQATLTLTAKVISPAAETNTAAITHVDQFDLNTTNNTSTATVTPQLLAPTVTNLQRFGFHAQPTELVLTFDSPLDPVRAQDVANYRLFELLHGGRLRRPIPIKTATYDSTVHTVTLTFKHPTSLALHRHYELIVNGTSPSSVAGSTGIPLDGKGNGVPGSDYVRVFGDEILEIFRF